MTLRPEFVEHIPEHLDEGVLYVSIQFGTVVHRCACGCGEEVVTPLGPAEWRLIYDGRTVSLEPSIGNWSFPCRSHYWIDEGIIRWARDFSEAEIERVRQKDRTRRDNYYRMEESEVLGSGRNATRDLTDDEQRAVRRPWALEKARMVLRWVWRRGPE